jgi:Tfp pilus assembly protein PilN
MINLLPPEVKQGYRYARFNVGLRRWVLLCLVALIGMGGLATYGLLTLQQSTNNVSEQIASTQAAFQKENFSGTQTQVQDISNSFRLVVKVLGQEVLFSELIKQIAAAIPANANLTGLNIGQTTGGIDISAEAMDYNTATQVQVNLADPANKIFSKADIVSITCNNTTATNPQYPCTVNLRALFAVNNPFLFINSKVTSQ